jgi:hypothetical protein
MKIRIKTLVDVTRTDVRRRDQGDEQKLRQQQNYQTLLQTISLRNLIDNNGDPYVETRDITGEFGSTYKGEHKVWTYEFEVDHADAYATQDDPIGLLKEDLEQVPVLGGLKETFPAPKMFILNHKGNTNITVELINKIEGNE